LPQPRQRARLRPFTKPCRLRISPTVDAAGHALVQEVELVVPLKNLIDVAGELDKLAREQARLEKELERIVAKLGNAQFMGKAPEAVVAKEREKEAEIRARLAKTVESTQRLNKLR
jgi:valyl-tRNA synthetase